MTQSSWMGWKAALLGATALSLGAGCDGSAEHGGTQVVGGAPPTSSITAGLGNLGSQTFGGATSNGSPSGGASTTAGSNVDALGGATSAGSGASAGGGATSNPVAAGGTYAAAGSSSITVAFEGIPSVGQTVKSTSANSLAGTVTAVQTQTTTATFVTVTFPAEWQCPKDVTTSATGGATSIEALSTDPNLIAADCHALAALRRPALLTQSQAELANRRAAILNGKCNPRTQTFCIDSAGNPTSGCYDNRWTASVGGAAGTAVASVPTANGSGAQQYSTTNTQVASVDEADYVKNDGQTIYVLAKDGLHVIDAWPASQMYELNRVTIPGEPRRLFLSDNRLVVYTRMQAQGSVGAGSSNPSDQGCTYGYQCRFTSEGGHSLAIVFDVSAPAAPRELVRYEMSGGFVAARRVGAAVYTVVHDVGAPQLPGLDYTLQANSLDELDAAYQAKLAEVTNLIRAKEDAYFLPWVQRTTPDGTKTLVSTCDTAYAGANAHGMSFVSLTAFDLTKLELPTRLVVASNPGYVYASAEALYLAVDQAEEPTTTYGYTSYYQRSLNSVVHKFALNGTALQYRGSITLPGHILNQFAMDEQAGILRVASTAGWVPDPNVVSYVTTVGETTGTLKQLGQVGGIAPTEDIRSVRFDGDRGFVVTFKKTDPLFVFDLADATNPRRLGELKIPGFSTYMHRLDANHLLAVGFEADDQGSFAYFNGIQVQIFDVTDLANPTLLHKRVIGTRGSGSEALTNHLAFNYFPPKKMLAIPITVCEGGGNGVYGDQLTFAGLMAFDISLDAGITEHGRLPFVDPAVAATQQSCNLWWTDSKSLVKRSIFMDDWVFGLSDQQIRVANLATMSQPAATLSLPGAVTP